MEEPGLLHGWEGVTELLAVRILVENDSLRLVLAGELDLAEVGALRREVSRALETWPEVDQVKVDLSHLRFVDVAGVRALTEVCRRIADQARSFRVVGVPRHLLRALEVSGIEAPLLTGMAVSTTLAKGPSPTAAARSEGGPPFPPGSSGARPGHRAD